MPKVKDRRGNNRDDGQVEQESAGDEAGDEWQGGKKEICLEIQSAGKNNSLAEAVSVEYIIQQGYIGTSSGEANIVWGLKFSLTLKMDSTGEWFKMFR